MKRCDHELGIAGLFIAITMAGCASTTVTPQQETFATNLPAPPIVLVYRFAVNMNEVTANQGLFQKAINAAESTTVAQQDTEVAREVADAFADEMVTKIIALGLPAQRATPATYVPQNALIITGEFVDVDEGNRTRRLVIGFGAGQAKVDAEVQVLTATPGGNQLVVEFTTHADSGDMPGAAVTMGAGAAAQGGVTAGMAVANVAVTGVKAYRSEIAGMSARSAGKAAQFLAKFFAQQGWISADKAKQPLF
jgi:hypothetical protein